MQALLTDYSHWSISCATLEPKIYSDFFFNTYIIMLLLSFIHTLAIHAPLPFPTTGAVCPREVFGLAHKQSSRSASTPQRCTRTGCIRAVLGLISKCKLALSVGIVQRARQVRRKLDWFVGFVQQTLTWKWIKKKEKKKRQTMLWVSSVSKGNCICFEPIFATIFVKPRVFSFHWQYAKGKVYAVAESTLLRKRKKKGRKEKGQRKGKG